MHVHTCMHVCTCVYLVICMYVRVCIYEYKCVYTQHVYMGNECVYLCALFCIHYTVFYHQLSMIEYITLDLVHVHNYKANIEHVMHIMYMHDNASSRVVLNNTRLSWKNAVEITSTHLT